MTIQSSSWSKDQKIPGNAGRVLEALANYANHRTGRIEFEPEWIAEESCVSVNALPRFLGALVRNKRLFLEERGRERRYWINMDCSPNAPWSWDATENDTASAAEGDERPCPPVAPENTPARFDKALQAKEREEFAGQTYTFRGHPIIEGTSFDEDWSKYLKARGEKRPFIRTIILKDGSWRRGYYMPSAVPPKEEEEIGA